MENPELYFINNKPIICESCKGKLFHIGGGSYQCKKCDSIVMDDFGKVKQFLEANGPSSAPEIAQGTGVRMDVIEWFLKDGRLEIIENSRYYLQCEKCGCSIRSGRFCIDCAKELTGGIHKLLFHEIGDRPKKGEEKQGKMHFLDKKNKK